MKWGYLRRITYQIAFTTPVKSKHPVDAYIDLRPISMRMHKLLTNSSSRLIAFRDLDDRRMCFFVMMKKLLWCTRRSLLNVPWLLPFRTFLMHELLLNVYIFQSLVSTASDNGTALITPRLSAMESRRTCYRRERFTVQIHCWTYSDTDTGKIVISSWGWTLVYVDSVRVHT